MNEAPSNKLPVNQAALHWLKEGRMSPDGSVSYLAQLASWGLEKGVNVPVPMSPSQPERDQVESAVNAPLDAGPKNVAFATEWFLSNPNLPKEERAESVRSPIAVFPLRRVTQPVGAGRPCISPGPVHP